MFVRRLVSWPDYEPKLAPLVTGKLVRCARDLRFFVEMIRHTRRMGQPCR